ncbi:uncharacterized protein LOC131538477 [Onychostoma macrolepis]|uniref:uncharacterized protein LOC131538477 n=1 Tax=Onychostoma macrolepis TaxID=369639 RepID=UPI00272BA19B|nr:uncharacterized protein LOC131538477 [Onychostoma macrolepis]
MVSDRGPQFISRVWKAFFRLLVVTVSLHSWAHFLPWADYAQNSLRQKTIGLTPFQCILGYQPLLFPWMEGPSEVPAVDYWFRVSKREWDSAHVHLQRAVAEAQGLRRCPVYLYSHLPACREGLSTRDLCLHLPFTEFTPHSTFHSSNHVLLPPQNPPSRKHLLLQKTLDEPSVYQVRDILDLRRRGGRLEYLVNWEGYKPGERSWVARDDVLDPSLLEEFHRTHPDRPAPRGRGRTHRHMRVSGAASGGGEAPSSPRSQSPVIPVHPWIPAKEIPAITKS